MKRCAITGAADMARRLGDRAWLPQRTTGSVLAIRPPLPDDYAQRVLFRTRERRSPAAALREGIDAFVHCAYDFRAKTWPEKNSRNQCRGQYRPPARGSGWRGEAQRLHFVDIQFISRLPVALSAGPSPPRSRAAALELGCSVVRPGLVWSQTAGSLMRSLEHAAAAAEVRAR